MKNKRALEIDRRANFRAASEKLRSERKQIMRSESDRKRNPSKTESYPMDQWLNLSCDRYGYLITAEGEASSRIRSFEVSHSGEPDVLGGPSAHNLIFQNAAARSPIRRILIPIDAVHVKPVDLKPILSVAQRFDAEVSLVHCYEMPLSFHYAVGRSAPMEITLHCNMVRTRLLKLCIDVRKFFSQCRCQLTVGSIPVEILRASQRLQSDLIMVPLSLVFVSHSWTAKDLLDELVRKAHCSVLGIPWAKSE
jgi:hypothetical protein